MLQEANIIESSLKLLNCKHEPLPNSYDEQHDEIIEADLDFQFDETINIGFGRDTRFHNDKHPKK